MSDRKSIADLERAVELAKRRSNAALSTYTKAVRDIHTPRKKIILLAGKTNAATQAYYQAVQELAARKKD